MQNIIYCYTGTGNSLETAKVIAKNLGNTEVVSMSDNSTENKNPANAEIIGFVFPVHHWNMPAAVRNFVGRITVNPNAYIFAVAACGGIAVNTLNDFNDLIISKGTRLSYSKVFLNVSQYIVAYNRFPDPEKQLPKSKIALQNIADDIKKQIHNNPAKKSFFKNILRFVMRGSVKKFPNMDKDYNLSTNCIGCGICETVCPAKNIRIENKQPIFLHKCGQCMACIQYCPNEAINYKNKTQKRQRYHHPNISAKDLAFFRNNPIIF